LTANSSLMNWTTMRNLSGPLEEASFVKSAMLHLEVDARSFMILTPDVQAKGGYTPYKRVP